MLFVIAACTLVKEKNLIADSRVTSEYIWNVNVGLLLNRVRKQECVEALALCFLNWSECYLYSANVGINNVFWYIFSWYWEDC